VLAEGPAIKGSSIPEWIHIRVGNRMFQLERNALKMGPESRPIGPGTKHLAERAQDAGEWANAAKVDFPMSSLAGALEEAELRLMAKLLEPGKMLIIEGWELGVSTKQVPWRVYHAKYDPKLKP
jgi:hypothetical protein